MKADMQPQWKFALTLPLRRSAVYLSALALSVHFLLIVTVVTHTDEWIAQQPALGIATRIIGYYSAITFNNRNFGFFAPSVTSDWKVKLTMTSADKDQRDYTFPLPNREMRVRLYSMIGHAYESDGNVDIFSRSWAIKAMNENPDVSRVDIEIAQNQIPTLKEYREGKRITSQVIYRTAFELNDNNY